MRSKFRAFHIVMQTAIPLIALGFLSVPVFVYFNPIKDEPLVVPTIITAIICFPLIYFLLKDYRVITLTLFESNLQIRSVFQNRYTIYTYADIERINVTVHKVEGVARGAPGSNWGARGIPDVNYVPQTVIYFNDGYELELYDDIYANVEEMITFIESKRASLN